MSSLVGKVVMYNGGTDTNCECSDPNALIFGKRYVVISECDRGFQTNLSLRGIIGEFNSVWFDGVKAKKEEWLAKATLYKSPRRYIGGKMNIQKLYENTGRFELITTTEIQYVKRIYGNIYLFETENEVYVTKVNLRAEN